MNEKETHIPEGAIVNVYFSSENGELRGWEYVRGPQGPGDCFVLRSPLTGKVSYIGNFELIEQVAK